MIHGEGVKITEDIIPDVCKQKDVMDAAVKAGQELGQRLREHDRAAVTQAMQAKLMTLFGEMV